MAGRQKALLHSAAQNLRQLPHAEGQMCLSEELIWACVLVIGLTFDCRHIDLLKATSIITDEFLERHEATRLRS